MQIQETLTACNNANILRCRSFFHRPRNTKEALQNTHAEEIFRKIDTNSDNMVDAAEWVDYSKDATSIWDFVELLGYTDIDGKFKCSLDLYCQ